MTRDPLEPVDWLAHFWEAMESGLNCSCSGDCDKERVAAARRIRELEEQVEKAK